MVKKGAHEKTNEFLFSLQYCPVSLPFGVLLGTYRSLSALPVDKLSQMYVLVTFNHIWSAADGRMV